MLKISPSSSHTISWMVHCRRLFSTDSLGRYGRRVLTSPAKRARRFKIATLRPASIQDSDFLDISSVSAPYIHASNAFEPSRIRYYGRYDDLSRFPKNCRGFLYYHHDPLLPALSGSVRFRLTPDASPSSFEAGTDLMLPDRPIPWGVWLAVIATSHGHACLAKLLLKDALVSPLLLERCRELGARHKVLGRVFHSMLFTLEQPFVYDVNTAPSIAVLGEHGVELARVQFTKYWGSKLLHPVHPYVGRCMVRFERSLAPEHAGRRVVVLRVLEILKPTEVSLPAYDGLLRPPKAGSLLMKEDKPIAIDVDKDDTPLNKCLKLLLSSAS